MQYYVQLFAYIHSQYIIIICSLFFLFSRKMKTVTEVRTVLLVVCKVQVATKYLYLTLRVEFADFVLLADG